MRIPCRQWRSLGVLAAAVAVAGGCQQSERPSVSGQILRSDGAPLVGAMVTARSTETGKWASGTTDAEGRYVLGTAEVGDGIPPGDYYVTIAEDRGEMDQRPRTIPEKYERPTASGLHLTVVAGENATLDAKLDAL